MVVTFGGVTLSKASKIDMQQDNYTMTCSFDCETSDYGEITALLAYSGKITPTVLESCYVRITAANSAAQKQSLVINGTTYANCYISEPIAITERLAPSLWKYTIKFIQETYSAS
jgi:hypothetical protein